MSPFTNYGSTSNTWAVSYSDSTCAYSNFYDSHTYKYLDGTQGYKKVEVTYKYSQKDMEAMIQLYEARRSTIEKGKSYKLPDGAMLVVDNDGNYQIDDTDAKVVYKANRVRDFSPHLNASDMVVSFLENVAKLGLRRQEALNLPLHLFISWLIIEAAERDGDDCADVPRIEQSQEVRLLQKPRCLTCGRFINRLRAVNHFPYCSPTHAEQHIHRIAA